MKRLGDLTWPEAGKSLPGSVVIWPIGAIEAHGPHLPLSTDVIIAEEMSRRAAIKFEAKGRTAFVLPALAITPAKFAAGFSGTLSLSEGTAAATICDVAKSLYQHRVEVLVLASAHVDPSNLKAIDAAMEAIGRGIKLKVVFPNITRKPWVLRLPEEFKRGGAHAGLFETSLVMAVRGLVRENIRAKLPKVEVNLGEMIKNGARSFEECGGPDAYFGDPASATEAQGNEWYEVLSDILVEAVA